MIGLYRGISAGVTEEVGGVVKPLKDGGGVAVYSRMN